MLPMQPLPLTQGNVKKLREKYFQIKLRVIDTALLLHPAVEVETGHGEVNVNAETSKCYPCHAFLSLKEA